MTTTKRDLAERIAETTGTRSVLVETGVQQFIGEITTELAKGSRLERRDFDVSGRKTTPAGTAHTLKTLEEVQVSANRRVVFKPERLMREGAKGEA